jgi:hypothetical protein
MKKLSIQDVKKLTRLEMKAITGGSGTGGGGGGGGGTNPPNDCNTTCLAGYTGYCHYVCTYCYIPPGQNYGLCQA